MAVHEAVLSMEIERTVQPLAEASPSTSIPNDASEETCDASNMQLALVTPRKGSERLRPRTTQPTYYPDVDSSWSHSLGFAKTTWNQSDILNLIDAVKKVEESFLSNDTSDKSRSGRRIAAGNKWQKVAELLPDCWMSSSDRFHVICRGKFQELRRNYQAMLRNSTVCKFFTEEICQRMKDYIEEVPPKLLLSGSEDSMAPNLIEDGNNSPKKRKGRKMKKSPQDKKQKSAKTPRSESVEIQPLRRSPRVPKRSCKLDSSSEQLDEEEEEVVEEKRPRKLTSPESRTSRSSRTRTAGKNYKQPKDTKRPRVKMPEDDDELQEVETVGDIFKRNFELLRSNIDFSTEYHLHKHLHKHFDRFLEHMNGLIDKIDRKIDRLDRKFEAKLESLILLSKSNECA